MREITTSRALTVFIIMVMITTGNTLGLLFYLERWNFSVVKVFF